MAIKYMSDYVPVKRADTHLGTLPIPSASFAVGEVITGQTSGMIGVVRALNGTDMTVEGGTVAWNAAEQVLGDISGDATTTGAYVDLTAANQPRFDVLCHKILSGDITKNDLVIVGDDDSEVIIEHSTDFTFTRKLQWLRLSESDLGTIIDYYANLELGRGMVRYFYWEHPTEGTLYTVRFSGKKISDSQDSNGFFGMTGVLFKVVGYFA